MKIFYPLEVFYPSQAGGPANTVYWITKNLAQYEFQPIIAATDKGIQPDVPLNKWLLTDYGKVIYVKTRLRYLPLHLIFVCLTNFYRADIVHISSFFYPAAFITAFAARILKKKLVWSARGELDRASLNFSRQRKRPVLWLIKNIIGKYPVFHATCDEETNYIRQIFGADAKIAQIPNYIEIPAKIERNAAEYLLYLGRINRKKGLDNLIKALSDSREFLDSEYILKIAGRGIKSFEDYLSNLVSELNLADKIIFVGQVEGEAKQKLLADAYFTIMPSHTENFGNVVLESLAQSTPVIASKGSPWEILEREKIGFWTDNSVDILAHEIGKILKMPKAEYESLRSGARGFVEREFDISRNIAKWIDLYRKL